MKYEEIKEFLAVKELVNKSIVEKYKMKTETEINKLIDESKLDEATFSVMLKIGDKIKSENLFQIMRNIGFKQYTRKNNSSIVFNCVFIYNKDFKIAVRAIEYEKELENINVYKLG